MSRMMMRQVLVGSLRRHPVSSLFPRSRRFSSIQDESAPTPPKAELGQQTLAKDFSSASEEEVDRALGALQRKLRMEISEQSFEDAVATSVELRSLASDAYGKEGNPIYAAALNDTALAFKGRGEFDTAAEHLVEALQIYDACGMKFNRSSGTTLHNLGVAYKEQAQHGETKAMEKLPLLERSTEALLDSIERIKGMKRDDDVANQRAVATTRTVLASVYRQQKKNDLAKEQLDQALDTLKNISSDGTYPSRTAYATALNNAALFAKQDGDHERAQKLYLKAINIRENTFGENHPQTLVVMHNLAELYDITKQEQEAILIRKVILERMGVDEKTANDFFQEEIKRVQNG